VRECPNQQCDHYDIVGSEHSCRWGKHPEQCIAAKAWRDGVLMLRRECLPEEVDEKSDIWADIQRSIMD